VRSAKLLGAACGQNRDCISTRWTQQRDPGSRRGSQGDGAHCCVNWVRRDSEPEETHTLGSQAPRSTFPHSSNDADSTTTCAPRSKEAQHSAGSTRMFQHVNGFPDVEPLLPVTRTRPVPGITINWESPPTYPTSRIDRGVGAGTIQFLASL
jgi:hypothetical protein